MGNEVVLVDVEVVSIILAFAGQAHLLPPLPLPAPHSPFTLAQCSLKQARCVWRALRCHV